MLLSRTKAADDPLKKQELQDKQKNKVPDVDEFINNRDYSGAIALLEFLKNSGKAFPNTDLWIAFCAFHMGDYARAQQEYEKIIDKEKSKAGEAFTYLACCMFMLGMYKKAEELAMKGPKSPLQVRLLFHISHKLNDEEKLMSYHHQLQDQLSDQLSLASMHYMRNHYQEAIDIYKRYLLENRHYLALNVYVALCYYKLDYYDISQEVLAIYLQSFPDSAIGVNLKACNHYRLYNGKAAEQELRALMDSASLSFSFAKELFKHNLVVFQNGEGALQSLPSLVDVIPEARLNLVIYYLKQDNLQEAYALMKDVEPSQPAEYILKGVVNATIGQEQNSREHLKVAQQYFQLVGGSASECDTIAGRQCMASCFFILRQFEDVLVYLNSIKSYFYNDDTFNFNHAQAQAAVGSFKDAEQSFLLIENEKFKNDYTYLSWLARCYIRNSRPRLAWELYLKLEHSNESFSLLQLIANDCYKMGHFYYAARAFDILERMDPNPEYWEGKRGACAGAFQLIVAGHEPRETLREILQLLRNTSSPQAESMFKIMRKWAKDNKVNV